MNYYLRIISLIKPYLPHVALIVVLTLWDTSEYRHAAVDESEADAYIIKENMVQELLPTLNQLLTTSIV